MHQRALVFIKPQTPENFLSVYMAGALTIIELERWAAQMWLEYGIVPFSSNSNLAPLPTRHSLNGPDAVA